MSGAAGGLDAVAAFEATWRRLQVRKRWLTLLYGGLFAVALLASAWVGEFNPIRLIEGLPRIHEYVAKTLPVLTLGNFWGDLSEWFYGLPKWLRLLWETILIAYIATLLGTVGALALCFHAATNTRRGAVSYWITRRVFEVARTIPELVFALIFVFAFGIGPLAGILAIAIHSMGGSGKLFAEAVENIDMKPVDGAVASGATWTQSIRYAVLPQVMSNFASYALLRFEINVRGAAVMGFVGAGGIGQDLIEAIRKFYYSDVSALLLLIIVTVMIIDLITERIRHALLGWERVP